MKKLLFVALLFVMSPARSVEEETPDDPGFCVLSSDGTFTYTSVPSTRAECPVERGVFIEPQVSPLGGVPVLPAK